MSWGGTMPRGSWVAWAAWAAWAAWVALAGRVGAATPWAFREADGCGPKGRCLSNRLVRGRKWREGGRHYGAGEVARGTRKREAAGREGERVAWERAAHLQGVDKGVQAEGYKASHTGNAPRNWAGVEARVGPGGKGGLAAWRWLAPREGASGAGTRCALVTVTAPWVHTPSLQPIGAHRHRRAAAERPGDGSEAGR